MAEAMELGEALDLILCSSESNRATFHTLNQICLNIIANPGEAKFRRLKLANPSLQAKVFAVPGGRAVLTALGFVQEESAAGDGAALVLAPGLELPQDAVARVMEMLEVVGGPPPPPTPPAAVAAPLPTSPSAGSGGGGGGGGSFFSGLGLSAAEREKRAKEGEERAKKDAEEKRKLLAQAAANQKERELQEALHGGVKASHKVPVGEGKTVKLCVRSWGAGPGRRGLSRERHLQPL
jgi:hypothetical protein